MSRQPTASRREFLKTAAAGAAAIGVPYFAPATSLGWADAVAPSDRIVMGCIGTGGQGRGNMQNFMGRKEVQVIALCDVDKNHLKQAADTVNKHYGNTDVFTTGDFRKLLEHKDLEAVSIATPDHWHGLTSVAAANAKKDIYCEKPLSNSVGEGRAIADAVAKNKVILQCGSHERSGGNARSACELVRNGRIGKLHTVRINLPCSDGHHQQVMKALADPKPQDVPAHFDYDMWLGHTAKVPYAAERCHFFWRFILAYGGGEMTDRGAHVIDIGQLGAGMDDSGPVEFKAQGKRNKSGIYDTFMEYDFENTYANGVRMIGKSDGTRGVKFEGDKGWIFVHIHGQKLEASDPAILQEKIGEKEIQLGRSPGHHQNFLECIRSRKDPVATAEIGHRTASLCHLTNIAMLVGRTIKWDPKAEKISGDAEASALLTPKMREPWKLS